MKSVYNVPLVRTQSTTALTNIGQLLDVQVTGVQNNDILVYNSPKWVNKPQVLNNNQDVNITSPAANESLVYNGLKWANKELALNDLSDVIISGVPQINQVLTFDGDFWGAQTPTNHFFANLNDVAITGVQNNDSIVYNSATSKYVNKKKYAEFDNYVNVTNGSVTAVARTVYFCNLAIINLPTSTLGEQIKIINTNGTACTVGFPGIIYHLVNNFNTSYTTTDACQMTLEGIIGGNWQIVSFTGRWLNITTGKYLVNNGLADLRDISFNSLTTNQSVVYNGSTWVNSSINYNNLTNLPFIPSNLDSLTDVVITTPTTNQSIVYNGTNFVNSAINYNNLTNLPTLVTNLDSLTDVVITTPTTNQSIVYNGTNFVNSAINYNNLTNLPTLVTNLDSLTDVVITTPATNQIVQYNGTNFVNNALQDNTYDVDTSCNSGATVTAAINKTYMCNLGTLNIGSSSTGAVIKIINSGSALTINFSGLVYINGVNYFNTSFTSNELMYMEIKNYFNGTAWMISNLSPRIFYPTTLKYIYYSVSDLDNIRNVTITSPSSGQYLTYNGSIWTNTTLGLCHPTSELQMVGSGTTFTNTFTTVNIWYQFTGTTSIINNPSAVGVFSLTNTNLFQWTYTGSNSKYFHSAISISASVDNANDTYQGAFFINNTIVSGSLFIIDYAANNKASGMAYHKVLLLNTNDIVDFRMRNITSNGKVITVSNLNLLAMGCCSSS